MEVGVMKHCYIEYKPEISMWIAWITDGSSIFNIDNIRTFTDLHCFLDWASSKGVRACDMITYI